MVGTEVTGVAVGVFPVGLVTGPDAGVVVVAVAPRVLVVRAAAVVSAAGAADAIAEPVAGAEATGTAVTADGIAATTAVSAGGFGAMAAAGAAPGSSLFLSVAVSAFSGLGDDRPFASRNAPEPASPRSMMNTIAIRPSGRGGAAENDIDGFDAPWLARGPDGLCGVPGIGVRSWRAVGVMLSNDCRPGASPDGRSC